VVGTYGTCLSGFGARNSASSIVVFPELLGPTSIVSLSSSASPSTTPLKWAGVKWDKPSLSYRSNNSQIVYDTTLVLSRPCPA
jgi:hypothetical protein